ncbi:MAG TPA: HAD-IC family P-type ATPase, partial [Candidatus Dojkabacteria bacterium]
GEVVESEGLLIDESALSGESDYVKKKTGVEVLSGSFVVGGAARYTASKIGEESLINKITLEAKQYTKQLSPLQEYLNKVVRALAVFGLIVILLLFIFSKQDSHDLIETSVSIVSAVLPQGIILTITLSFLLGTMRMLRQDILVQNPSSIETLAGVKVICMDKTGTLTTNDLKVEKIEIFDEVEFPLNQIYANLSPEKNKTIRSIQHYFNEELEQEVKITGYVPFTSQSKISLVECNIKDNGFTLVLGAPEVIKKFLSANSAQTLEKKDAEFAENGFRNVCLAYKSGSKFDSPNGIEFKEVEEISNLEKEMKLYSLIAIKDTLRDGAGDTIENFIENNVRPIVISGDGPGTLESIIKQLKIKSLDKVTTGAKLASLKDNINEFEQEILGSDVFARVTPEQKVEIIKVFQSKYGIVGMIGDGVNDTLAIKQSNLGISFNSASNSAKNLADIILLKDSFDKIPQILHEGQNILFNSLRTSKIFLSRNFFLSVIIVLVIVLGLSFPFTPKNLTLLSATNTSIPILFVIWEKMKKVPKVHFLSDLYKFILNLVISITLPTLVLDYVLVDILEVSRIEMQSTILTFLVLTGLVIFISASKNSYRTSDLFRIDRSIIIAGVILAIYSSFFVLLPFKNFFELYIPSLGSILVMIGFLGIFFFMFLLLGKIVDKYKLKLPGF